MKRWKKYQKYLSFSEKVSVILRGRRLKKQEKYSRSGKKVTAKR
jgi:hypothetical protein